MKRTALALTTATMLALTLGQVTGAPAAGSTTIVRESVTTDFTETNLTHDCRPGVTGELHGVQILTTQSVETDNGFHIHGSVGGPGRIDWSDGTYTLIDSVDHFSFNAVGKGTNTFTETHTDSGDFYSADGDFEYRITFHEVEHFTETNGVVRVDFSKGHFHFFGDCS